MNFLLSAKLRVYDEVWPPALQGSLQNKWQSMQLYRDMLSLPRLCIYTNFQH